MSSLLPFSFCLTITVRPCSCGRDSSQYTNPLNSLVSERPIVLAVISAVVISDGQEPKDAIFFIVDMTAAKRH